MFTESAEYYDLIYSTFKDYRAESATIAQLLRRLNPQCRTVLDVACGTGEHARLLASEGFTVDGLDVDAAFVRIARQKNPAGRFFEADMGDFHFGRQYDAVLCLFSSIGYLLTIDRVTAALRCFREHLAPGGVAIVEPWFQPGRLDPNRVARNVGEAEGLRVSRVSRVQIDGRISRLQFEYEIIDGDTVRHAQETHELGLFTTDEMKLAFQEAGLDVEYDPEGLTGRGLFLARKGTEDTEGTEGKLTTEERR